MFKRAILSLHPLMALSMYFLTYYVVITLRMSYDEKEFYSSTFSYTTLFLMMLINSLAIRAVSLYKKRPARLFKQHLALDIMIWAAIITLLVVPFVLLPEHYPVNADSDTTNGYLGVIYTLIIYVLIDTIFTFKDDRELKPHAMYFDRNNERPFDELIALNFQIDALKNLRRSAKSDREKVQINLHIDALFDELKRKELAILETIVYL